MNYVLLFLVFCFGSCLGSFLNVVIHRLPLGISVVTPRSRCPSCEKLIYWYENIPLVSFLFLRGKCSECEFKISKRYPAVEMLCGVIALVLFLDVQSIIDLYFYAFYLSVALIFVAQFLIDIDHKLLPDSLNLYLACILLAYSVMQFSWQHIVVGALIGGGFPFLVTWIFYKLRGQIGLGGGDIKLYAALGLYLGPLDVVLNIFLSCFLGAVIGLLLIAFKKMNKQNPIPFGPFILVIATLQIFFPDLYSQVRAFII